MKKPIKYILLAIVVLFLVGVCVGLYMYFMPNKSAASQKADYTVLSSQLYNEFSTDENKANAKYLNKIIEIKGTVNNVTYSSAGDVTLSIADEGAMGGVLCTINFAELPKKKDFAKGEVITIKGICTGYLLDVVLNRCVVVEK